MVDIFVFNPDEVKSSNEEVAIWLNQPFIETNYTQFFYLNHIGLKIMK